MLQQLEVGLVLARDADASASSVVLSPPRPLLPFLGTLIVVGSLLVPPQTLYVGLSSYGAHYSHYYSDFSPYPGNSAHTNNLFTSTLRQDTSKRE